MAEANCPHSDRVGGTMGEVRHSKFHAWGAMAGNGRTHVSISGASGHRLTKSWRWLLLIMGMEASVALAIGLPQVVGEDRWELPGWSVAVSDLVALLVIPIVVYASTSLVRQQHRERAAAVPDRPPDGYGAEHQPRMVVGCRSGWAVHLLGPGVPRPDRLRAL